MIRIYRYNEPYVFRDFESYLFNTLTPVFDFNSDKLTIHGIEYRISSINALGGFNLLIPDLPQYNISLLKDLSTTAIINHNSNFSLNIKPNERGCYITIKVIKHTENDIIVTLPNNSHGVDVVNNQITLSGLQGETFYLYGIYENSEYDWITVVRSQGLKSANKLQDHEHTKIEFKQETIPTFVFGALSGTTRSIKDFTIHIEGSGTWISEVVNPVPVAYDRLEVYQDGEQIRDSELIWYTKNNRIQADIQAFKTVFGKQYSLRFYKAGNVVFPATFYNSQTYYENSKPYPACSFTTDYTGADNIEVMGLNTAPVYFFRGAVGSIIELNQGQAKATAENFEIDSDVVIKKNLRIDGNIIQNGENYETHAEDFYTSKDFITLRDSALAGLLDNELAGFRFLKYNGNDNLILAVKNDGVARVGDETGQLQALATREDNPINGGVAVWNELTKRFETQSIDFSTFALTNHTHSQYSLTSHTHSQYAPSSHTHSYLSKLSSDTIRGKIYPESTSYRNAGMYGVYDSYKVGHVWSIGTAYQIDPGGANLGNLYGMAYFHSNSGNIYGGGHQIGFVQNGVVYTSIGSNIWTRGSIYLNEGTSRRATLYYDASGNYVMLHNNAQDSGLRIYDSDGRAVFGGKCYATDFQQSSDKTLKKNIQPLTKGVDKLRAVSFEWRDKNNPGLNYGFIAQEVAKHYPELVTVSEKNKLAIKQNSIIALLVKEVQELKAKIK